MHTLRLLSILVLLVFHALPLHAGEPACHVEKGEVVVGEGDGAVSFAAAPEARSCLAFGQQVWVAAGVAGVILYGLDEPVGRELGRWQPSGGGEVVALHGGPGGVSAITAHLEVVPLATGADGLLRPAALASVLGEAPPPVTSVAVYTKAAQEPEVKPVAPAAVVQAEVVEVRPDVVVVNAGSEAGIRAGDHFEIRSQELTEQYNLATGKEELLPCDRVTAVAKVTHVTKEKALVKLGRGDRARMGDHAVATDKPVTGESWFPGYERSLNRIRGRIGPFLGIDTLSAGMLTSVMYDRTFSFPMRLEAGFSNIGFVFGENFAAPFRLDLVPSYDTDYFEVGIGLGYVYSSHERKRGMSFLQKVRLGTVDGLSVTVQNAFIYQRKSSSWLDFGASGSTAKEIGTECTPSGGDEDLSGHEFSWEGIDATLAVPLTSRVTLVTDWSYSNSGWFYGDIGIRTLVLGNGGHGTLIIPVTIGGVMVNDYVTSYQETYCDAESETWSSLQRYDSEEYGGPVVTIGIDYRWR